MTQCFVLWQKVCGIVLLGAGLFTFDPNSSSWVHQLVMPALFTIAMLLLTRALLAVALACFAFSLISTDFHATHWVASIAYPMVTVGSLITIGYLLWIRFTRHIRSTHSQRWQHRSERND